MNDLFATQQTMLSTEIVKIINELRDEGAAELRHDTFMAKVEKVLGEAAQNFLGSYKGKDGTTRKCYALPKRETHLMVMSESYKVQAAVYDRMTELEQQAIEKHFAEQKIGLLDFPKTLPEALELIARLKYDAHQHSQNIAFAECTTKSNNRSIGLWIRSLIIEYNLDVSEQEILDLITNRGYLIKSGRGYSPVTKYEDYFIVSIGECNGKLNRTLDITGKGIVELTDKVVKTYRG